MAALILLLHSVYVLIFFLEIILLLPWGGICSDEEQRTNTQDTPQTSQKEIKANEAQKKKNTKAIDEELSPEEKELLEEENREKNEEFYTVRLTSFTAWLFPIPCPIRCCMSVWLDRLDGSQGSKYI